MTHHLIIIIPIGSGKKGKDIHELPAPRPGSFTDRGVHFVAARVTSQRTGDAKDIFTQVKNLDRARVIVE